MKISKCFLCGTRDATYPKLGICSACYMFQHYWQKRSVGDKIKHLQKLDMWAERGHKTLVIGGSVTVMKKRTQR